MSNMFDENKEIQNIGGSYGGGAFGGIFAMIILVVVVLWLLFKDGNRDNIHAGAYPYPYAQQKCGVCVEDESNWQEDRHLTEKLCAVDKDVIEQGCLDRQATHAEGEATRALIQNNYIQDLRDKLAESNSEKLVLKNEMFTERKFDQVLAAIGCTNNRIERFECEIPKRAPVWAECVTPNTHDVDCGPRRSNCCGDNYSY